MTLDEYLNSIKMKPIDFAKVTGLSNTTIYRILNGLDTMNSTAHVIQWATGGLVTTEELLPTTEPKPKPKRRSFRHQMESSHAQKISDNHKD